MKIEMMAEKDKTTKNFDRFKFDLGSIISITYLPKGVNTVKTTLEYDLNEQEQSKKVMEYGTEDSIAIRDERQIEN